MKKLLIALMVLGAASVGYGDLLAGWEVTGVNASAVPVFTNTVAGANINSNANVLSLGSGVSASATADTFGGTSFNVADLGTAISGNKYISWTLQAQNGWLFSVTNISMNFNRTGTGGSNMVLRSSADGFSSDLNTWNNFAGTAGGGDANIGMSLSATNSLEFRLYIWGASAASGADRFRTISGNDLQIQGTTMIPEPATLGLLGLGALALIYRRFRK